MATRSQRALTYDDYVRFPDDGRRWELIGGEAYMVPGPDAEHQNIVGRLFRRIADHLDAHGGGQVFVAPFDVLLSDVDVVQPDVIFVADAHTHVITQKNIRGVPTWLIEVVSDPVRDKRAKRDRYMQYDVPEYWAVDPHLRTIDVYRPGLETVVFTAPASASPSVLPGLTLELDDIFGPDVRPRMIR
jgi:Uma2 family endonuclease